QDPTLGVADDIIVVEALTPGAARLTDPAVRAASSNVDGGGVFAPGDQITVLDPDSSDGMSLAHGTSFAAPFVAGAAAFLLAIHPQPGAPPPAPRPPPPRSAGRRRLAPERPPHPPARRRGPRRRPPPPARHSRMDDRF